jgi:hypothetical protein
MFGGGVRNGSVSNVGPGAGVGRLRVARRGRCHQTIPASATAGPDTVGGGPEHQV